MKLFCFKILILFIILFLLDSAVGRGLSYMVDRPKGGYVSHHKHINDEMTDDIIVFGSSRAIYHYNPKILSDSLNMTCYNCGQDGNGIILNYGEWLMIKKRYSPKMIIMDIMPEYDILVGEDNHKYLGWLRLYYDRDGISEIFDDVDHVEKYKMMSGMYRYNTKFMEIITDYISPLKSISSDGFRPVQQEFDSTKVKKKMFKESFEIDQLKLNYLDKFIDTVSPSCLYLVASPIWYGMDPLKLRPVKDLCDKKGVVFMDFTNSKKYVHNNDYFRDGNHMNLNGANEFTKDLSLEIKKIKK